MLWAWIATIVMALFAGAGIKWAVDRVWPPAPRLLEIPPEAKPHEPRLTVLDDTMDVLGAGVDVGLRMGRHSRQAEQGSILEQMGVPTGVALPGGGWNSGACTDGPPTERPADYPGSIDDWPAPGPGQP